VTSDDPLEPLVDALVRTTFEVTGVLTRLAAVYDVSLTQVRLLGILRDRRARVTDLAAYLGLDKSTMSGLVDRAERRGLVARAKNPDDGRAVDVYLTPAGAELTRRAYLEARRELAPLLERLQADERGRLVGLLEAILGPEPDTGVR